MLLNYFIYAISLSAFLVHAAPYDSAGSLEMHVKAAATPEPGICKKQPMALETENTQTSDADPRLLPTFSVSMDPSVRELLSTKNVVLAPADYHLPPGVAGVILKATYFFTCGLTGSHSRRFVWAAHHGQGNDLILVGVHNIDSFTNIVPNDPFPGSFRAIWVDIWDIAYENLCCRFFAAGYFRGRSYIEAISMNLVHLDGPIGQRPYVSEDCLAGRHPPNRVGHACPVTFVQVEQL